MVINSCLQSAVKKAFNPKKMSLKHMCLRNDCQLELTLRWVKTFRCP